MQGDRSPEARGRPGGRLPGYGGRSRLTHFDPVRSLEGHAPGRGAGRKRPADRQPALASLRRAHRPSQPSQDRRHRRPHHLLRQPELRRPGIPGEGEIRSLGRRGDALRGTDRTTEPVPFRKRLDVSVEEDLNDCWQAASGLPRRRVSRASDRHRPDGALFGDAGNV